MQKDGCILAQLILPNLKTEVLAIGLDVDGVLRDTAYSAYLAFCNTVCELGGSPPLLFDSFVRGFESDFSVYYRKCGVFVGPEVYYPIYLKYFGVPDEIAPFGDVKDSLVSLQGLGFKIFVVSSHETPKLHEWFESNNINDHMLCIYGGSRDKAVCIKNACRDAGVDPKLTCYVGDYGLDMRAAKAAEAIPIGITRGYLSRDALVATGAAHVIDQLVELVNLFQ